jgi:hypothetical protein
MCRMKWWNDCRKGKREEILRRVCDNATAYTIALIWSPLRFIPRLRPQMPNPNCAHFAVATWDKWGVLILVSWFLVLSLVQWPWFNFWQGPKVSLRHWVQVGPRPRLASYSRGPVMSPRPKTLAYVYWSIHSPKRAHVVVLNEAC